jgi:hypothetical protein
VVRNGKGNMPAFTTTQYSDNALLSDYAYFAYPKACSSAPPVAASCSVSGELMTAKLRRLTRPQFANTIKAAFAGSYSDSIWPDMGDTQPKFGMIKADQMRVQEINFKSTYDSVDTVVKQLLAQNTVVTSCINATTDTCFTSLMDAQGKVLWRRPLTNSEKTSYTSGLTRVRNGGGNRSKQMEFLLKALMLHTNFLHRSELGKLQNGAIQLDAYEIASLLSFALWDAPPDTALFDAAANNSLLQPATIDTQIKRMMADAKFDQTLAGFYSDFLQLRLVSSIPKNPALGLTPSMRDSLLTSANLSLVDQVKDHTRDIGSVMASTQSYANDITASLFGVSVSGGAQQKVSLPATQRTGILTHPAFLTGHAQENGSGIVQRGVFTLKQLLCIDLGDPPAAAIPKPIPPNIDIKTTSSRNILVWSHSSDPCATCHVAIDPAGFGFENFDTLGRYRTTEGNNIPIDASGTLSVSSTEMFQFNNSVEYTKALMDSPSTRACVARRYLENVMGEALSASACELNKYNAQLGSSPSPTQITVNQLAQALAALESIRLRK